MSRTYFEWLEQDTPSRAWINNPTQAEIAGGGTQGQPPGQAG